MFPKDSLILLYPLKFYPSHPLVCSKFSKVAWIRFRESVRGVSRSQLFSAVSWAPEKMGPIQRLKILGSHSWLQAAAGNCSGPSSPI